MYFHTHTIIRELFSRPKQFYNEFSYTYEKPKYYNGQIPR